MFNKANPNHDDKGRFAEGPGGGSSGGGSDPFGFSSQMSGKTSAELDFIANRANEILSNPRSGKKAKALARKMEIGAVKELARRKLAMSKHDDMSTFLKAEVAKVDTKLGLVFGWGIVCKVDGEPYFDSQRDHIPEDAMLKATTDFMEKSRMSGDMHARDAAGDPIADGNVVFSFPMTTDIAKALEIDTHKTGWMVAVKPSPDVLAKYESGEYSGFSIGGSRLLDEDVV